MDCDCLHVAVDCVDVDGDADYDAMTDAGSDADDKVRLQQMMTTMTRMNLPLLVGYLSSPIYGVNVERTMTAHMMESPAWLTGMVESHVEDLMDLLKTITAAAVAVELDTVAMNSD